MKKYILFLSVFSAATVGFSQARLVLNNDPYLVIANSAYLVIENPAANGITEIGSGGRIVTEAETNIVRWNITSTTGSYTLPYYDVDNASEIPFTVNITGAGSAGGSIDFSTYDNTGGTPWNNAGYMPSDVTNMNSFVGGANNSPKVIDRFWIADASSYGTKPTANLDFTYIDAEWSAAGNTITEANLGAQRFETPNGDWDTYTPQGTINTATNRVTAAPASAANFWRSWTLSDNTSPLPIELVSFNGECMNGDVILKWSTATETNNDFFTIERSEDGITFHALGSLDGAGNSSTVLNYTHTDHSPFSAGAYYRITQTDYNGSSKSSSVVFVSACADPNANIDVYNTGSDEFSIVIDASFASNYTVTIYNALGQIITSKTIYVSEGLTKTNIQLNNIDDAMYFVNITNGGSQNVTKKIVIN